MKKVSKTESEKQIKDFFVNIKNKTPMEIKKIKKLAMKQNIKLGKLKKTFCKKCYSVYKTPLIRIKNKIKSVGCENCGYINRFKIS